MIHDSSNRLFDVAVGDPSMKFVIFSGVKVHRDRSDERSGLSVRGGQPLGSRGSSSVVIVEKLDVMVGAS